MKKRYGVDTNILMGMEILTEKDNAKTKTDAAQDAIILREIHEMASDPCPNNIEYDAGMGKFIAPHKYYRFGPISRCSACRKEYRHCDGGTR